LVRTAEDVERVLEALPREINASARGRSGDNRSLALDPTGHDSASCIHCAHRWGRGLAMADACHARRHLDAHSGVVGAHARRHPVHPQPAMPSAERLNRLLDAAWQRRIATTTCLK
jgi:hypothetical protein